jgi:hypothetical protein
VSTSARPTNAGLVGIANKTTPKVFGREPLVYDCGQEMIEGEKVRVFWEWFSGRASDFGSSFQNRDLLQELDQRVNQLGSFAWEIGPGQSAPNAFVLSPGGSRDQLAETTAIVAAAPPVQNWEFYAAKPPRPWKPRFELHLEEREYAVDATAWRSVLLRYPDGAHEVVVEAPNIASLPEHYQRWAAEIALDGLLGERRRLEVIDEVSVVSRLSDRESDAAFPIKELPERIR